ncbi:TadE family protein [Cellulomonas carbonis]|uniref:TadE family protein n=1 Tax=Cellulomonas carbonis TaxID=1386092 RepID=UPI0006934A07|nr:TadE family protein [Cellulomonas carbonis]
MPTSHGATAREGRCPAPSLPRRASVRRLAASDRGASSVELVMYTPVLMLVTFLTVQFGLTWHGNHVAGAVAREAARVARAGEGTPAALADAERRGIEFAAAVGGNALTDVTVDATPLPATQEVRVTVTGRSAEIVRGFAPRVSVSIEGPVETFRPDL